MSVPAQSPYGYQRQNIPRGTSPVSSGLQQMPYGQGYKHPTTPQNPSTVPNPGDAIHDQPAPTDFSQLYQQQLAMYQQAQQQQQGYFQQMSGLQNQLTNMIQQDPGQALYQQLLGMYDPNLGAAQHQQVMDQYKPIQQQSQGTYLYGY